MKKRYTLIIGAIIAISYGFSKHRDYRDVVCDRATLDLERCVLATTAGGEIGAVLVRGALPMAIAVGLAFLFVTGDDKQRKRLKQLQKQAARRRLDAEVEQLEQQLGVSGRREPSLLSQPISLDSFDDRRRRG